MRYNLTCLWVSPLQAPLRTKRRPYGAIRSRRLQWTVHCILECELLHG
jgi:hypothetical protein